MSRLRNHYEEELSYLREQGKRFSNRFPKLAPFLSQEAKDPDVERLLEGFALIAAKLQCKIQDAYPELSSQVLEMIAPLYLSPQPSATVMQFKTNPTMAAMSKKIARGTELRGQKEGSPYFFTTTQDLLVQPLALSKCEKKENGTELDITLSFDCLYEAHTHHLEGLEFFIGGELSQSYFLSHLLLERLKQVEIEIDGKTISLPQVSIKRRGLDAKESLVPYFEAQYHVFQLLCDYFVFPEKFLFLEFDGLDFKKLPKAQGFKLKLRCDFEGRHTLKLNQNTFKLHCVPAVNLWRADAAPFYYDAMRTEYPLRVESPVVEAAPHSVLSVSGWSEQEKKSVAYQAARDFPVSQRESMRYQTILRNTTIKDEPELYLELWNPKALEEAQVISTEVLAYCPNAFLELNGPHLVSALQKEQGLEWGNVLPLSSPVYPPLEENATWKLIAHLALRFKNMREVGVLKQLIMAYDFAALQPGREGSLSHKIAEALLEFTTEETQHFHRGELIKGSLSVLKLKEDVFLNQGEIYLFGSILAHILAVHAPFNSFHDLRIEGVLTGFKAIWKAEF